MSAPDTRQPIFDPGLDVATVVFSHVQCVKTRVNLAVVSKLWRDASKPAAAYPRKFDWGAFPDSDSLDFWRWTRHTRVVVLLDNDVALSLPHERVVRLLGGVVGNYVSVHLCDEAAQLGSLRLLKWARENNFAWSAGTCLRAAAHGQLSALQYLHENGCPWDLLTCSNAAFYKRWDCLQYMVDNKCPGWKWHAKYYAEHLR
jgi:hypothetical protein|tara:strand:+ start:2675 stop:3277 length:603 start_codon:yes stop_codon:yes gene_type:complete